MGAPQNINRCYLVRFKNLSVESKQSADGRCHKAHRSWKSRRISASNRNSDGLLCQGQPFGSLLTFFVLPQPFCFRGPASGIIPALITQMVSALRGLEVCGMGAGLTYHHLQHLRVFQHRTGPQMVTVEGLMIVAGHEQRGLECLQQRLFPDV